ncbi:MAG: hypothetical protein OTI34_07285 [Lewinella sp.]|nr:hypothetical protein [Lewinella sp.]
MSRIDNQKTEFIRMKQAHYQHIGATFSVCIVAHDAVPKQMLERLKCRKEVVLREIEIDFQPNKEFRKEKIHEKYSRHIDKLLHQKRNQEHVFLDSLAAEAMEKRIQSYAGKYYDLVAYSIMSNHVHLQLDFSIQCPVGWNSVDLVPDYVNLSSVIGQIKGGGAYDVNSAIGRKGKLWGGGYYDRYMRSHKHFMSEFWYIVRNAEVAGIVNDWRNHLFTYGDPNITG